MFTKIKYFFGTIYRGMIGIYHNTFDKCPEINSGVEWFSIGETMQGKKIRCYFVRNKGLENKGLEKKFLVVGGIHGNEVGTVKLANHIINYFNGFNGFNGVLFVIPCLNLDGYEQALKNPDYAHRGRVGRFNSNEVDLNRNFPSRNFEKYSDWGIGKNYNDQKIKIFCGEFAASEPETAALIKFIKDEKINNLIILHNVGSDVVISKKDEEAKEWAEIYKKYAKFKIRHSLGYSGGAMDWSREQGIHYMNVEGSSRWGSDWARQRRAIEEIFNFKF